MDSAAQPVIGIPCRDINVPEHPYPHASVPWSYITSVLEAGGIPLLIPSTDKMAHISAYFSKIDGLLLSGGEDICPSSYQQKPSIFIKKIAPARDQVEFTMLRWALEKDMPVLGICRGMQIMNVALGGTLHQHLPSVNEHPVDNWSYKAHSITVHEGTILSRMLEGRTELAVNSIHHQAVASLGKHLSVSASSNDEVIEGIESPSFKYLIGIQCHPEALWQNSDKVWLNLFTELVQASTQS